MAATQGSIYQSTLQSHLSGSPPNADPQRPAETFEEYVLRMAVIGFNPDIGLTESDSEYLARLASYVPAPPLANVTASYSLADLTIQATAENAGGLYYPTMVTGSSGQQSVYVDTTDLTYNQATKTTFLTNISASTVKSVAVTSSLFGTASWASHISSSGITGNISSSNIVGNFSSSVIVGTVNNAITASQGAFAWGSFTYTNALTQSTYNCSVARTSTGLYPVTFTNNAAIITYAVIANGVSGSAIPSTGSLQCVIAGKATTGFSIYTYDILAVGIIDNLALMDASTASFVVFSY